MKPKFTPKPWRHDGGGIKVFADNDKMCICDLRGWGYLTSKACAGLSDEEAEEVQKANGDLIEAAPEMYEALEKAVEALKAVEWEVSLGVIVEAEKALKKARGGK